MMKKLLFLFTLASGLAYGQFTKTTTDSLQFEKTKAEIIAATGKNYKPVNKGKLDWREYVEYQNEADTADKLFIVYFVKMAGENVDLERKGVKTWIIERIAGKYLTMFELYKRNYSPSANLERIQKSGKDLYPDSKDAILRNTSQPNLWEVQLW